MEFRTTFPIAHDKGLVDYGKGPLILLGSCFTDGVGSRLEQRLFNTVYNPLGPLYNPASINRVVTAAVQGNKIDTGKLFLHNGLYRSFICHTLMCAPSAETTCGNINRALQKLHEAIHSGSLMIITAGTAKVYEFSSSGEIVANCHKLPGKDFTTRMLTVDESAEYLEDIILKVSDVNPNMKFIFTVSPIRHIADGMHINTISKAVLQLAIDKVCKLHNDKAIYFPAYELVNDDLRDYRFYSSDMCHPSETAVDYVYKCFEDAFMTEHTVILASQCLRLTRRLGHRQLTADRAAFERFHNETRKQLRELSGREPALAPQIDHILSSTLIF